MILVTGAGGMVGTELVKVLQERQIPFRAAFHSEAKLARARAEGIDAVRVDFADPVSLKSALSGITSLFLLSPATPSLEQAEKMAAERALEAGVGHLVKLSVWRASEREYDFARWHRSSELAILALGIPATFLRPNSFLQNFVTYHGAEIRHKQSFALPAGHAKVSHIDVRDIAAVAFVALTDASHRGRSYDLSGPESLSYHQVAQILSVVLGRKIAYQDLPEQAYKRGMMEAGVPEWLADALVDAQHYARRGQASDTLGSVQQITGRRPISVDRFARDYRAALL
jgi:uncharacterized protein YbjT (DUF2867 family)